MPITPTYVVKCDACHGVMDGECDTREAAEAAREELGWVDLHGGTACPKHNPADRTTEK